MVWYGNSYSCNDGGVIVIGGDCGVMVLVKVVVVE